MKAIKNLLICLVALHVRSAFCSGFEELLQLQGEKYIQARDEMLENNAEIPDMKSANPRMHILLDILREHKKHPELFIKLPEVIKKGYETYRKDCLLAGTSFCPYTFIKCEAANFMMQGIETKEYFKSESATGNFGDLKVVKYTQTDEEVARAKELNRAARLAVIEYLWKIADDRRTIYELTWILEKQLPDEWFDDSLFAVFEDVLQKNPDEFDLNSQEQGLTGTARCSEIFRKHNYKKALPLLKRKFDACYKARNFADCFDLGYAIKELGDENDKKRMDEMLPLLQKMKSEVIEEFDKKWKAEKKAREE